MDILSDIQDTSGMPKNKQAFLGYKIETVPAHSSLSLSSQPSESKTGRQEKALKPDHVFRVKDVGTISIYVVKNWDETSFRHDTLRRLLLKARQSYSCYGDVPLLDRYDEKSTIYLARTVYDWSETDSTSFAMEEWFSVRYVHAAGNPSSEDLEITYLDGIPVKHRIIEQLGWGNEDILNHIATISRICKIPPRLVKKGIHTSAHIPEKNRFSSLSFAFINKVFLQNNSTKEHGYKYITAMGNPYVFKKLFSIQQNEKTQYYHLKDIRETLSSSTQKLHIHRDVLSYKFPAYFLDIDDLSFLTYSFYERGLITRDTLVYYTRNPDIIYHLQRFSSMTSKEKISCITQCSSLYTAEGHIYASSLKGVDIRKAIDHHVDDAIALHCMSIDTWSRDVQGSLASLTFVNK